MHVSQERRSSYDIEHYKVSTLEKKKKKKFFYNKIYNMHLKNRGILIACQLSIIKNTCCS